MSKKRSVSGRVALAFFRGIGILVGGVFSLIASMLMGIGSLVHRPKNEKEESRTMHHKDHGYKSPAENADLELVKKVSGNYELFNKSVQNKSLIMLIFGKRGSGKSALGFRILENIHAEASRKCYVLGVEQQLLPTWIETIDTIEEASNGGVILIDEGAVSFGSRDSMSKHNKELASLMAVARHKDLTLIFITQNTGLIDRNVLKLADTLLVKEGSLLQLEMERTEMKNFYAKSKPFFDTVSNKIAHVYVLDSDFEGMLTYDLPSFWTEKISKNRGA